VDRGRFVLVLSDDATRPPRPEEPAKDKREKRRGRLKDPDAR
jgi:hypothetical protein